MSSGHDVPAIAERMTVAIATADTQTLAEIYAPQATIWHNTDGVELSVSEILAIAGALGGIATAQIDVTGLHTTPSGFVQTQINTYMFADGSTTAFHAALIVVLDEQGRITRLDEYLDSTGLQPLVEALGAGAASDGAR